MSSRIGAKTKQKRPRQPYRIVYNPIPLPQAFPLREDSYYEQGDAPITFLHGHDCLELGYCYEGAGVFVVGEKVLPFQAGAVSFITPSEFHLARSMAGTQSKWAWIYLDPVRLLPFPAAQLDFPRLGHLTGKMFRNIITPQDDRLIPDLVRELVEELRTKPRGYQLTAKGLVWTLMARVGRLAPKRPAPSAAVPRTLHRIAPALYQMAAGYADQPSIRDWARSCHVSTTHFRRLFRQALGKSPHQYLTELRVRMAATRLHSSNEKVVVIAGEVGFATLSSFNRAFRQIMKLTPRQWRTNR